MVITFISDTHNKHKQVTKDLPGGDVIVHCGDISSMGHKHEVQSFLKWFNSLEYTHKVFIAGNHDFMFEKDPELARELLSGYPEITYLQDSSVVIDGVKFYGTPWQPEFCDWAFNLPRNGKKLQEKWDMIPDDTDVLLTHGPSFGCLDLTPPGIHAGCELLAEIDPVKVHAFGHIHHGYGIKETLGTFKINAACLNERYEYTNKPQTLEITDWEI